jgi:ABC-type antimicrobial peptide transport system permease subunit
VTASFMSTAVSVFMLLVGLVLLIACANVANLLLARANSRRKEFATRTALGATRSRMVGQLLTETVLLSALGGIIGLIFARWAALGLMSIHIATDIPIRLFDLRMDWRIFGFTFAAALLTGMIAGLFPSLQASRTDLADALKAGGRCGGANARITRKLRTWSRTSDSLGLNPTRRRARPSLNYYSLGQSSRTSSNAFCI